MLAIKNSITRQMGGSAKRARQRGNFVCLVFVSSLFFGSPAYAANIEVLYNELRSRYMVLSGDSPTADASVVPHIMPNNVGVRTDDFEILEGLESAPARTIPFVASERDTVELENKKFVIRWDSTQPKYRGSVIHISNAKTVLLRNLLISTEGKPFSAYDTIHIENAHTVRIENIKISGSAQGYHIRVSGAAVVFIDNVEIKGAGSTNGPFMGGGGIWLESRTTSANGMYAPDIAVVRHAWIHGYDTSDVWRNHDGINATSPRLLLISRCLVESFGKEGKVADAAIDVSFRESNHPAGLAVIEDNLVLHGYVAKTPGQGNEDSVALWRNNIFVDTQFAVYNDNWTNILLNNSFINRFTDGALRLWGVGPNAKLIVSRNAFFLGSRSTQFIYGSNERRVGKEDIVSSVGNLFVAPRVVPFSAGPGVRRYRDLSDWKSFRGSSDDLFIEGEMCVSDVVADILTLDSSCAHSAAPNLKVSNVSAVLWPESDFNGMSGTGKQRFGALLPNPIPARIRVKLK